jgi:hypothetical protein
MAQLNTTCPACGAPHARKLSVIHAEGISTVKTDINTVGTLNTIGRQKITTRGTSTGVQQTQESKDAARPVVPPLHSNGAVLRGVIVFLGLVALGVGVVSGMTFLIVAGFAIALCSLLVSADATPEEIAAHNEKTKDVQAASALWDKTFQCGACGNRFVPSESKAA